MRRIRFIPPKIPNFKRLDQVNNRVDANLSPKARKKEAQILNIYNFHPCSVSKKLLILARRFENGDKKEKIKDKRTNMYCILAALLVKSFRKYAKHA
ncbi:hypothetical protein [Fibrobacter succinogenes]|uniref:hypothetical protein n=1 Tax=Fibrobacter succinogenes TaxID=833 RepID=UPI0015659B9D|nr:hypothetical protein [Fibrobacter succinogenes]